MSENTRRDDETYKEPEDEPTLLHHIFRTLPLTAFATDDRFHPPTVYTDNSPYSTLHPNTSISLETRMRLSDTFKDACRLKQSYRLLYPLKLGSDKIVWLREFGSPHPFSEDKMVVIQFLGEPHVENSDPPIRRLASELLETVELQNFALDAACGGLALLTDGRYIYGNRSHFEMYGYTPEECIGKEWRILYAPEEQERIEQTIFPLLQRDKRWQGEVTGIHKRGYPVEIYLSLAIAETGALICSCIDITQRKQAQLALEARTRLLDSMSDTIASLNHEKSVVLDAAEDAIFAYDDTGRITYANLCARMDLQLSADSHAYSIDALPPPVREFCRSLRDGHDSQVAHYVDKRANGESRVVEIRGTQTRLSGATFYRVALKDISSLSAAVTELQQSRNSFRQICLDLAEMVTLKENFTSIIGHELRTPIANIIVALKTLAGGEFGEKTTTINQRVALMTESALELLKKIEQLISHAQVPRRWSDLALSLCSISEIVRDAVEEIGPECASRNQPIEVIGPSHPIPDCFLDTKQIALALKHLLSNASKFSPIGTPISVEVSYDASKNDLTITIIDHGQGITTPTIHRAIHAFTQADHPMRRTTTGTGIGLSIVRRIVDAHQGRLYLHPLPTGGTRVSICIPHRRLPLPLGQRYPVENRPTPFFLVCSGSNDPEGHFMSSTLRNAGFEVDMCTETALLQTLQTKSYVACFLTLATSAEAVPNVLGSGADDLGLLHRRPKVCKLVREPLWAEEKPKVDLILRSPVSAIELLTEATLILSSLDREWSERI